MHYVVPPVEHLGIPVGRSIDRGPVYAVSPELKRIFALVQFDSTSLRGAVPDAKAVVEYLHAQLQVPTDHIRCLLDHSATRTAIIDQLLQMRDDPRIEPGDPILVYYAGHGGEAEPPSTCQTVHSIPDRTLGALLARLAETVILDCCHSGSGTRTTVSDPTRTLPDGLDSSILSLHGGTRHAEIAPGFLRRGLRSHVLLAACGSKELAMEQQERGIFTVALLRTLSTVGAHRVTYRDLLRQMYALPGQNPQCEGYFQDRILFNSKLSASRPLHIVSRDTRGNPRSRDDPIVGAPPLTILRVSEVRSVESTLVATSAHPTLELAPGQSAYALQTEAGTDEYLQLHIATETCRSFVLNAIANHTRDGLSRPTKVQLVDKASADLEAVMEASIMHLTILHPLIAACGVQHLPFHLDVSTDDVCETLHAASHFFWHLKRTTTEQSLAGSVRIEFRRLREVPAEDEFDDPTYEPYGPDLNIAGMVDLLVDEDAIYGINLVNESHFPLYLSLFYFSSSDLSITSYYEPPSAGSVRVDPPLEPYGSVTIGYGTAGSAPYNYYLWENQELDVGLLKLFLSTEYVDLSHLSQESPFHGDHREARMVRNVTHESLWDTSLVTVVHRMRPLSGEKQMASSNLRERIDGRM
ncbi:uncharacterized protein B0H18DRAFT_1043597 [Fomitopsis serialis]|uniref:uncharacterized protein n=1 Tax=Fomitopsis serialis TaxID=139415 RepID=UPI0020075BEB|nr:uncharacterized protein B0H18DRAFT_1043597 [Neoantrodia serialis]KAH9914990.1 hypothetical protein B0H18DRAFT_1043597 [Neoantrodia serialis]